MADHARHNECMNHDPTSQSITRPFTAHIVKVSLCEDGRATIATKDGGVRMVAPNNSVQKRFAHGERVGYFRAELGGDDGIMELGDRLADLGW